MERRQQYSLLFRPAHLNDAERLSRFAERIFRETYASVNRPDDIEGYVAEQFGLQRQQTILADPDIETTVVESDGELIAYAELWLSVAPDCIDDKNLLEIRRLYVDQPWQGTSVASSLMQTILNLAESRPAEGVWLGVWEHSPRAQAFYRKSGFVRVGQHDFRLGAATQTDHIMYRRF